MKAPKPPSRRLERVSELLKREVSELIRQELNVEEVGLLSVNEVKLSPDLKSASVYVGFVGSRNQKGKAPAILKERSKQIQFQLGSALRLKWTPVLHFFIDDSIEKANRVLSILEELEKTSPVSPPLPANPVPTPNLKPAPSAPKLAQPLFSTSAPDVQIPTSKRAPRKKKTP